MSITSLQFALLWAVVLAACVIIPNKYRWVILLSSSLAYIALAGSPLLILYPVVTGFIAWWAARGMRGGRLSSRVYLGIALVSCIGVLVVFRYVNIFVYTYNVLTGSDLQPGLLSLLASAAPIGLSFYTMSLLGYIFDVYYEITEPEGNYLRLLLFISYYPLLISGPIIRYKDAAPQLSSPAGVTYKGLTYGLQRALLGFMKILVISSRLAVPVGVIFSDYEEYSGIYVLLGACLFTLQLYANFSGTMDVVLGMSQMIGIEIGENFRQPLFSRTIQEFWQRWHITLGAWLRDYVMYPVLRTGWCRKLTSRLAERFGKKKARQLTTHLGMFCVWLVAGIWHGGAWKYIWGVGILQFIYIIIGEYTAPVMARLWKKLGIDKDACPLDLIRIVRTFILMSVAHVFFRADSLRTGFGMLGHMFGIGASGPVLPGYSEGLFIGLPLKDWAILASALILLLVISLLQTKGSVRERIASANIAVRWVLLYALIMYVVLMGEYGPGYSAAEFIYQRF